MAADDLQGRGAEVFSRVCDVRDSAQVESLFQAVESKFGGVVIVFNAAGIITVGPLDSMTVHNFYGSIESQLLGHTAHNASGLAFHASPRMGTHCQHSVPGRQARGSTYVALCSQ